jgi:hypothetical protein
MSRKSTSESNDLVFDERCTDCEYNGYLNNLGYPLPGAQRLWCGICSGGRIRLLTVEEIAKGTEKQQDKMVERLGNGRARLVRPSELVDPYLVKVKKK